MLAVKYNRPGFLFEIHKAQSLLLRLLRNQLEKPLNVSVLVGFEHFVKGDFRRNIQLGSLSWFFVHAGLVMARGVNLHASLSDVNGNVQVLPYQIHLLEELYFPIAILNSEIPHVSELFYGHSRKLEKLWLNFVTESREYGKQFFRTKLALVLSGKGNVCVIDSCNDLSKVHLSFDFPNACILFDQLVLLIELHLNGFALKSRLQLKNLTLNKI